MLAFREWRDEVTEKVVLGGGLLCGKLSSRLKQGASKANRGGFGLRWSAGAVRFRQMALSAVGGGSKASHAFGRLRARFSGGYPDSGTQIAQGRRRRLQPDTVGNRPVPNRNGVFGGWAGGGKTMRGRRRQPRYRGSPGQRRARVLSTQGREGLTQAPHRSANPCRRNRRGDRAPRQSCERPDRRGRIRKSSP